MLDFSYDIAIPSIDNSFWIVVYKITMSSLIIFLQTVFLGMKFPLLSCIIYTKGYGERAVGFTYAANTIGAILGVIFAVHIGFTFLGLKNLLFLGIILDISLGVILFFNIQREKKPVFSPKLISVSSCSLIIISFTFLNLDKYKLASGVCREGVIFTTKDYHLNYYKDGKIASISVVGDGQYVSIRTNGKSDSAIALSEAIFPSADEFTSSLAALIPYFYKQDAKNVAVIGLGTGLTSHVALLNPKVSKVDSDFHPIIERNGPKLRFYGAVAREILELNTGSLPILELLFNDSESIVNDITHTPYYQKSFQVSLATKARDFILKGNPPSICQQNCLQIYKK